MANIKEFIEAYAKDLKNLAYVVLTHPDQDQLPSFASFFDNIDIVATKEGEGVLVQVKQSRMDLKKDPNSARLAEVVKKQRGWRFDLVVLDDYDVIETIPVEAKEPTVREIQNRAEYADAIAEKGDTMPAFLMAWATLEAAMRHVAADAKIAVSTNSPSTLLRILYSNGLLPKEEFDQLNQTLQIRNAAVHGKEVNIDRPVIAYLTAVITRLMVHPLPING
jgi:hypothetical protein